MSQDGKDGSGDELELELDLDLDLDALDSVTKPGSRPKSRERSNTQSGGSHAPPPLDAPTVRPPDDDFRFAPPVRHSMIPGPGLKADNSDSRPTDPGPGPSRQRARKRSDSTKPRLIHGANNQAPPYKSPDELSELECVERLGSLERTPKVKISEEEIFALGLDHRAGFLYSQIDGLTSLEDLLSISPMSREDSLRIFVRLLEHDAIGLK